MAQIHYLSGDATQPQQVSAGDQAMILVHCCNDRGQWGKGFVLAISKRWPHCKTLFKAWFKGQTDDQCTGPLALGQVQFVPVTDALTVANVIGQVGLYAKKGVPPVRYEALAEGLAKVAERALEAGASVHMPRIACGLAGGQWSEVEALIDQQLVKRGLEVVVYDYAPPRKQAP